MSKIQKILVIDDEAPIRKFLRVTLENEKYEVIDAKTGKDGIRELIASRAELVILDLGLPDLSGEEVILKIREWSQVPIIVLTAKGEEESKVKVLDSGADDYLTKPFSVTELMARIRVAERHVWSGETPENLFKSGLLEVDLVSRIVKVSGQEVRLTATEYDLLKLLIKYAGRVVTHRQILKEVWGPNAVEHTQYLRVYMGHLRKKLEPVSDSPKMIINEPGIGYRLMVI